MDQFSKKHINSIANFLVFMLLLMIGIIVSIIADAEVRSTVLLIFVILMCYYAVFLRIKNSTENVSFLCDCRFYVFSAILLYTVLPPIYCILTLDEYGGARVRTAYNATIYTSNELFQTVIMSSLFFVGILLGFFVRPHIKSYSFVEKQRSEYDGRNCRKLFICWLIVCVISTTLFLLPFIKGGFKIIQAGGSILDIDRTISNSVVGKIQEVFFSSEIMTVSTIAMLFYGYQLDIGQRTRRIILLTVVFFQIILALMTTRRARAVSIILCAFVIYIYWYQKKKNKMPILQIVTAVIAVLFLYFLEVFMNVRQFSNTSAGFLQLFDGISAYDSLLLSTRETPSLSMLSNILYGLFRPIPIIGKYIVQLFGMPNDAAPLYHWMADRYATYQFGGGLAYTPQLEAYLSGGYLGCVLFGFIYGYVFGKKRRGLVNLLIIAMAFSIARGNLQIVLSLMWPFGIIGYYLYDQFLFRRVTIGNRKT